jgi:hypothetical protein
MGKHNVPSIGARNVVNNYWISPLATWIGLNQEAHHFSPIFVFCSPL